MMNILQKKKKKMTSSSAAEELGYYKTMFLDGKVLLFCSLSKLQIIITISKKILKINYPLHMFY